MANANASPSHEMIKELDVLWITAGLSCDGETVAMTGATQPSIEDLVQGAIPGIPRVKLHNPFLAYEVGDAFMRAFYLAAAGQLDPFFLIIEGSSRTKQLKTKDTGPPLVRTTKRASRLPPANGLIA